MKTRTRIVPEHVMTINVGYSTLNAEQFDRLRESYGDRWRGGDRYCYKILVPEEEMLVAPTLAKVHNWLFGDWGPLYLSWRDGYLCPFDDRVGRLNITCSAGRRKRCGGLDVPDRYVTHLPPDMRRRCTRRVVCYDWCHVLSRTYWDIPTDDMLALPDDPSLTAMLILRRVYRESGFAEWFVEHKRRPHKRDWLKPIKGRGA